HVNVQFVKVKGHSGDKYNDLADALANEAMRSGKFARKLPNSYE
ncbi:MAG TPA: hypothetical protein DCY20_07670, partial [Firmicutes bacterium]|nr:hypothetical protein [Bacillota bacterium]